MEQFRQMGEVVGSLKALMVFRDDIQIHQRQCGLLVDILYFAYDLIAEEMRQKLNFEEKHLTWTVLEKPFRELIGIFKEGEAYVKQCLETKDWWPGILISYKNTDCVDMHIHNLLSCLPAAIEAIESAAENSGSDLEDAHRMRVIHANKYRTEFMDMKIFQLKFGKQYGITQDFCNRLGIVLKEDRWILRNNMEKKIPGSTKQEKKLIESLLKNLDGSESMDGKLLPTSILLGSLDYQVKRRIGFGGQYKEISWFGESFILRHLYGDVESLRPEISSLLVLSHPNMLHFLCGFTDESKKECLLVMEMMSRDLSTHIKETCGARKRLPFSAPVAVDVMLQIARGMEYLHSKKIYHGELNSMNVLVKARASSTEGYLLAKVSGFGLSSSVVNVSTKGSFNHNGTLPFIWYAPEVLEEQEQTGTAESKYTEKADVYSFAMVCFEILTAKVPFDYGHLQGDKMSRNIRAGERPLFPFSVPKFLTNLTRRCWNSEPKQRPSFSSICRILRYLKRFLALNPEYNTSQTDLPSPAVDYNDLESGFLRMFPSMGNSDESPTMLHIPFQMFVYRTMEKEKKNIHKKETSESGSEAASTCGDDPFTFLDDPCPSPPARRSSFSAVCIGEKVQVSKRSSDSKARRHPGSPSGRSFRPPKVVSSSRIRRTTSGHVSDSELP